MMQKIEQGGAVFRLQQFSSSNAMNIELRLDLVMSPFIAFGAIVSTRQQERNGGMKSRVLARLVAALGSGGSSRKSVSAARKFSSARSQYGCHNCSAIVLWLISSLVQCLDNLMTQRTQETL